MPTPFNRELGLRIRKQREVRGLTQKDLADLVGLSRTSVTNIECGRQRLLVDQLFQIANALAVSLGELFPAPLREEGNRAPLVHEMPTVQRWLNANRPPRGNT